MSIQRYDDHGEPWLESDDKGPWVLYRDHLAELTKLRAKLRKACRPGKVLARVWWGPGCLCTSKKQPLCAFASKCRRVDVVAVPKRRAGR